MTTTKQMRDELANSHLNATARKIWAEALTQPEFAKVQVIWLWGNGPDHNNGRCADFMVTIEGVPRAEQVEIGDGIRAYFKRHAKRLHVTGIIWDEHVTGFPSQGSHYRGPEGEARPYSGPSKHRDHVHVEVSGKAVTSWLKAPAPVEPVPVPVDPLPTPAAPVEPQAAYPTPRTRVVYADRMRPGVKDSDSVFWVQKALRDAGYRAVRLTGAYDTVTVANAKAWQIKAGNDAQYADGLLGWNDLHALLDGHGVTIERES